MALRFEGFSAGNLITARAIMLDASDVLLKAEKSLRDKTPKSATSVATWFGTLSATELTELATGIHGMHRAWTRPSFKIMYGTAGDPGENARVTHFKKAQGSVHGNTFAEAQAGIKHEMTLFAPMFTGKSRAKKNEQSQVQVILHELSHYGAGTIDVEYPDGAGTKKCYEVAGTTKAKALGKGFDNAENWGFFLMEFYSLITAH